MTANVDIALLAYVLGAFGGLTGVALASLLGVLNRTVHIRVRFSKCVQCGAFPEHIADNFSSAERDPAP